MFFSNHLDDTLSSVTAQTEKLQASGSRSYPYPCDETLSNVKAQIEKFQAYNLRPSPCDKTLSSLTSHRENLTLDECIKERDWWKCEAQTLKTRNKCLQDEVRRSRAKINEDMKNGKRSEVLETLRGETEDPQKRIEELEKCLKKCQQDSKILREEAQRLKSERDVLANRLQKSENEAREETEEC